MVKPCGLFGPFLFFFLLIRARAETESTTQAVALWECGYGQPGEVAGPAGLALCTFGTDQVTPPVTTLPTNIGVAVTHPAKSTRDKLF